MSRNKNSGRKQPAASRSTASREHSDDANSRGEPGQRRKPRWTHKALALLVGCLLSFVILEVFLRWYDPFALRIKYGRLSLPCNRKLVIENDRIDRIDKRIIHTRNSIGFRGPDPPPDFDDRLTIITVGGSTTECFYLSDGKTWPDQVAGRLSGARDDIWLNNAGLDGHSTHGHLFLLENFLVPLRPRVVVFLVGLNDVAHQGNRFDSGLADNLDLKPDMGSRIYQSLVETYAVFSVYDNWRRTSQADEKGLVHWNLGHDQLKWSAENAPALQAEQIEAELETHRKTYLEKYRKQLEAMVTVCKRNGIQPVFLTQPALYGDALDDETGIDLGRMAVGPLNGLAKWQTLELYNGVTREVARNRKVQLIDVARKMPKSTRLFYDHHHVTNEGAETIGRIVAGELVGYLDREFPAN